MNRKVNYSILFSLILILSITMSCNIVKEYATPEIETATSFGPNFSKDSLVTNIEWWHIFNDSVLVSLIDSALVNNKNMQMSISRIQQAQVLMDISNADYFPTVSYGLGASSSYNTAQSSFSNSIAPTINVSYTADLWGKVKTLNDISLQNYLATEYAQRALQISIISAVAQSYIALRDIDNRLIISEKTAENFQSNLDVMQARFNAGFISEVDLSQSKIQVIEARTAVVVFNRIRTQIENGLSVLLGKTALEIPRGLDLYNQLSIYEIPIGLPSDLLKRRPDILIAEKSLHAQTLRVGVAETLQYPSITLSANIGAELLNPAYLFTSLGGQLLGPLFNANKIKNNITFEELRTEELLINYENSFINAVREVRDAMISVDTYRSEYDLRFQQMELATTASELSWVRYDGGLTSYLEVLDLQSSQFNSQLKASEAFMQQMSSIIKLYESLGGGWTVDEVKEQQENKEE